MSSNHQFQPTSLPSLRSGKAAAELERWAAPEHIVARPDAATPMQFSRMVPYKVAKELMFEAGGTLRPLTYEAENYLDKQAMRGVRRLSDSSAAQLELQLRGR